MGWDQLRFLHLLAWKAVSAGLRHLRDPALELLGWRELEAGREDWQAGGVSPWVWVSHTGCPWCSEAMVSVLRKTSSSTAQ